MGQGEPQGEPSSSEHANLDAEVEHELQQALPPSSPPGGRALGASSLASAGVSLGRSSRHPTKLLVALALVAALVGAGAALGVARVTGWGTSTVVQRSVSSAGSIAERPADIPVIYQKVLPAVVAITATSSEANPFFGSPSASRQVVAKGTGVVVAPDGEIITNAHVVEGATSVQVTFHGSSTPSTATVIGADPVKDLALLKVDGVKGAPTVTFVDSSKVVVGTDVVAIGFALGLPGDPTVTDGIISGTARSVRTETSVGQTVTLTNMLQTNAAISSGNSGGPLVDSKGELVGINTIVATSSDSTSAQNIGFAIPAQTVKETLPELATG